MFSRAEEAGIFYQSEQEEKAVPSRQMSLPHLQATGLQAPFLHPQNHSHTVYPHQALVLVCKGSARGHLWPSAALRPSWPAEELPG